tara:strand:- start:500 stop:979 length:480 start_codon:yes stop_codon:yes gene_type:complete
MIKKEIKRFVELMKSNPDDFHVRKINGSAHDIFFPKISTFYNIESGIKEWHLYFWNTNWFIDLNFYQRTITNPEISHRLQYNLNIIERFFLKRNLKIHLNVKLNRSLLFYPYKSKLLALKNKFFLLLKNIFNIKKNAWIISIVLQLLTIGLVLHMGVKS